MSHDFRTHRYAPFVKELVKRSVDHNIDYAVLEWNILDIKRSARFYNDDSIKNVVSSLKINLKTEFHITVCHNSEATFNNIKYIEMLDKNVDNVFTFCINKFYNTQWSGFKLYKYIPTFSHYIGCWI